MEQVDRPSTRASTPLEPGLLSVLRIIIGVTLAIETVTFVIAAYAVWAGEIKAMTSIFPADILVESMGILVLLFYLYSDKIATYTGRWYLPIAIAFYSGGAVLQHFYIVFQIRNNPLLLQKINADGNSFDLTSSGWSLLVALLVPLVMVAWQYDFKRVLLYIAAVALFELPFLLYIMTSAPEMIRAGDPPPLAFTLVIRTIIFSSVGYIVTRMIGAQRQQREALTIANEKLRAHAATLEQLTISHERNRMARELHDTLAHSLSAVSVQLEAVDSAFESSPREASVLLTKALAQTRSGLAETRRAMQSLRASPLDDLGLRLALHMLAETTAQRGGLKLDLHLEDITELTPATEQNVYRIAQEALTNVLKHAGARQLAVILVKLEDKTQLVVRDDGVGFDTMVAQHNGHFGLDGIQERAALIGATVAVKSQPGGGTTVELMV